MIIPPRNTTVATLTDATKALFTITLNLIALRVPNSACNSAAQQLPPHLFDIPRLRSIVNDPKSSSSNSRLVLLDHNLASKNTLPKKVLEFIRDYNAEIIENHPVVLDYSYWTAAHLNLRKEYIPYKKIVGEVILDKNRYIRTVVNKIDSIDHQFRFFKMELLAGEDDMLTELKESNCKFRFDFSRVYWNSCLQTEHDRLVQLFAKGETVCDVMAGVGPFALPAAKNKGCLVFANDLNPESFKWLGENIIGNKLSHLVRAYKMDGRDFIWKSLEEINNPEIISEMMKMLPRQNSKEKKNEKATVVVSKTKETSVKVIKSEMLPKTAEENENSFKTFDHYIMNLPAIALEFLDAFRGLFHGREDLVPRSKLPIIHCHCFSTVMDNLEGDVLKRAEMFVGCKIPTENIIKIHRVRDVAPKKEMMCISFRLPAEVAYAEPAKIRTAKRNITEVDE
ncbi:tRNA(m(1)G37)methyltransferase [Physocladia obscura]|uniref:tRNA (guanine(37)-N1)-methyltransferase n=1 Tax=Physocladia obscura TaxID=109957 RepID=A0AAD5X7R1_9FUNG|nr:tRNA(m(1)G37)methyltransferase [Physocladia obscura]